MESKPNRPKANLTSGQDSQPGGSFTPLPQLGKTSNQSGQTQNHSGKKPLADLIEKVKTSSATKTAAQANPSQAVKSPQKGIAAPAGSAGTASGAVKKKNPAATGDERTQAASRKSSGLLFYFSLIGIFALFLGGGIGLAVGYVDHYLEQLPDSPFLEFYNPWMPSRIFAPAHHRMIIAEFTSDEQNREMATLAEMPKHLRDAVVALEDRRFYQHSGICLPSVFRALYVNFQAGGIRQGASTITIQLAEDLIDNGHITWEMPDTDPRDWERKFWEWKVALQIEKRYTKDEILEIYLNQVFLGDRVYGVARAAEYYFGKRVSDMNLKECALFAGMLQAPNRFHPIRHYDRAMERTEIVLRVMHREGYITEEEMNQAIQEEFQLATRAIGRSQTMQYPYYSWAIRRQFDTQQIRTRDDQPIPIHGPGIDVISTIEPPLQEIAEAALRRGIRNHEERRRRGGGKMWGTRDYRHVNWDSPRTLQVGSEYDARILKDFNAETGTIEVTVPQVQGGAGPFTIEVNPSSTWLYDFDLLREGIFIRVEGYQQGGEIRLRLAKDEYVQGAIIAVQPSTGKVLAMSGGYDFNDQENNGNWIRSVQSNTVQPGSAIKPLLKAAALNEPNGRWTPASMLRDVRREFSRGWSPVNFDNRFYGSITMRFSLVYSLNVANVWLLDNYKGGRAAGIRGFREFCRDMFNLTIDENNLTIALGTAGTSPWALAQAYQVLANGGDFKRLHMVDKVYQRQDSRSQAPGLLYEFHQSFAETKRLSPQVAYLVSWMLHEVTKEGTAAGNFDDIPFWAAGKTGTTNECTYAWFAGYSNDLLCVVFYGYDDFRRSLGVRMTGSQVALPVWVDFMKQAYEIRPDLFGEIHPPSGVEFHDICDVSGRRANQACRQHRDPRGRYNAVKSMPFVAGTAPRASCHIHGVTRPDAINVQQGHATQAQQPPQAPQQIREPVELDLSVLLNQ